MKHVLQLIAKTYDEYATPMNVKPLERLAWNLPEKIGEHPCEEWELADSEYTVAITIPVDRYDNELCIFGVWPEWHPAAKVMRKLRPILATNYTVRLWDSDGNEIK